MGLILSVNSHRFPFMPFFFFFSSVQFKKAQESVDVELSCNFFFLGVQGQSVLVLSV